MLMLLILLLSCVKTKVVVRDQDTHLQELYLYDDWVRTETKLLREFVEKDCKCIGTKYETPQCEIAAQYITVIELRHDWHFRKSLSLIGVGEPPTELPLPIPQEFLCPLQ